MAGRRRTGLDEGSGLEFGNDVCGVAGRRRTGMDEGLGLGFGDDIFIPTNGRGRCEDNWS